jgi:hypothetical protein
LERIADPLFLISEEVISEVVPQEWARIAIYPLSLQ